MKAPATRQIELWRDPSSLIVARRDAGSAMKIG
jgi:hypothetical protein